ncbi:MAG: VWA domain-containing protein [Rhodothermales bacterium]|nr:VWA domain-containing protein [Rhodothermales bacterium]
MNWLHPEFVWSLVAVPVAVLLFLWAAWQRRKGVLAFGHAPLVARLAATVSSRRRRWKAGLIALGVFFLAVALIGPRFGTQLREVKREGIDLVVALDVSASMMAEDVAPNRLDRARNEVKKLLSELQGDRVGLVTFAGDAFIQCPLTTDYSAIRLFLDVADPSLIPTPGTDFGAALNMAIQAFKGGVNTDEAASTEDRTRALLIVSDGENHIANLEQVLTQAREANIVVFTAGVGETEGVPIPVYRNGRRIDFKKDRRGRVVSTQLEEGSLQQLAEDGAYFRIARTSSSLPKITASLQRLEKTEFGAEEFAEYEEQYQWPLVLGLLLLTLERFVSDRRKPAATGIELPKATV